MDSILCYEMNMRVLDKRWKILAESDIIGCHIDKDWSSNG